MTSQLEVRITYYWMNGCGYCVAFNPTWERFVSVRLPRLVTDDSITCIPGSYEISVNSRKIEATECATRGCTINGTSVRGYPTIAVCMELRQGMTVTSRFEVEYMGKRDDNDMYDFIKHTICEFLSRKPHG